jgi:dihydrofolate synthase/folylpolyglutamate synthase
LTVVSGTNAVPWLEDLPLPLIGEHQKKNAALAVATVQMLADQLPVEEASIRQALSRLDWPGRLQLIRRDGRSFLLDGAHNVAGAQTLSAALKQFFPGERPVLILGVLADKDWADMCGVLAPLAKKIGTVPVSSERTANAGDLKEACQNANRSADTFACSSLAEALEVFQAEPFVVITGSLYLVGEALNLLQDTPVRDEKFLNEWSIRS